MLRFLPLLLCLVLLKSAQGKPPDPVLARTRARLARLSQTPDSSNTYSQVNKLLLTKESPVSAEAKALAPLLSLWPDSQTTIEKIRESKTFDRDRATFEKLLTRVGPALQLPYFYAKQDLHQQKVPYWLGLRSYCQSQDVLGIYLASQGQGRGLELLGNSLVTGQRLSGNGPLIQQMISLALSSAACESLIQVLQSRPRLPKADLISLQKRLQKAPMPKEDLANSLDIELLWNVTHQSDLQLKPTPKYIAFYTKWRPQVASLTPTAAWRNAYLKELDSLANSDMLFIAMSEIDYAILANTWREGLERRSLVDLLLALEIYHQQKGTYPRNLNELPWKDRTIRYLSDGKSYSFESTSPAWDSKANGPARKATARRFQSPK